MQIKRANEKITLLIIVLALIGYGGYAMEDKQYRQEIKILEQIENNLELIIYYYPLDLFTRKPLTEKDLKNGFYQYKIIVGTKKLSHYLDKIKELDSLKIQEPDIQTPVDVRIFGEFVTTKGKIYSFGLGGNMDNMLINGKLYKNNMFFYEFVLDFLPFSEIERYKMALKEIIF